MAFALWEPRLSRTDDVARLEGRNEELFNIGAEAFAVDGPVEQAGRVDAVVAQGGKESRGLPAAMRGTLSTSRWPFGAQPRRRGHVGFRPRLVDEHQSPGIDKALIGLANARDGGLCPGGPARARDKHVFFKRDAETAKEAAHHRGIGFDAALAQKAIAEGLKRDVRFLGPHGFQKITVRHQLGRPVAAVPDRLSRAMAFNAFEPLDRHRFADRVARPRRCAASSSRPLSTASITRLRRSCEYGFGIPAGLRPANRLNQNLPDSGIPISILAKNSQL